MRYPKLRELKEAIRALFKGPCTTTFPFKPHEPYERFRGRPYFHEEECTGCTACAQVCPTGCITVQDIVEPGSEPRRLLTIQVDLCIFCGNCQANCLTGKGIMLSREFALATTGKREDLRQEIEKKFVLCECCGEPVLPIDQFKWVANKLGALVFSNTSLLLFYLRLQGLASIFNPPRGAGQDMVRSDRSSILCPSCRRRAVLTS